MEKIRIESSESISGTIFVDGSGADAEACLRECLDVGAASSPHIYVVMDKALEGTVTLSGKGGLLPSLNVGGVKYIDASETSKTMDTVMGICSWLLEEGADRDAFVLAVGGGITTDMAGFAASIYKRGVRFAFVPTTLLAQVDAAIGGKTGVNFEKYKNMLGVIRQPLFTYISPLLLGSLPFRDFLSGAAEMLKTFVIEGPEHYERAVRLLRTLKKEVDSGRPFRETLGENLEEMTALVAAAARVKAGVVSRDCNEKGERRKLNLGHTFGHAIETLCRRREDGVSVSLSGCASGNDCGITHGEAVAMGMVLAARLAEKVAETEGRECAAGLASSIEQDLREAGLPVDCPFEIEDMAEAMSKDKKAQDGIVHFVLPFGIGDVDMADMTVNQAISLLS
ncbi:MAG: 3-dehydroquinate synthase family protein [Candidatus Cryptobacteroides sp.]